MRGFLARVLINAIAIAITGYLGFVRVQTDIVPLLLVGVILTIVNATVKPILNFISFPITIITLGLFILVINAAVIGIAAWLAGDALNVDGFFPAILAGIVMAIVNMVLERLLNPNGTTAPKKS